MQDTKKITEQKYREVKGTVRMLVRAREDFQSMRKRMDNRIGRKANGESQNPDTLPERSFSVEDGLMFSEIADEANKQEMEVEKKLKGVLERLPIYEWLKARKGIGTIAIGHIVGAYDIYKASTVSKLWQYGGMNPGMIHGKKRVAIDKYKSSMGKVLKEYTDANGKATEYLVLTDKMIRGDRLTPGFVSPFNKELKTALLGVMADGFIKAGFRWEPCMEEEFEGLPESHRSRRDKKINGKKEKDVPCRLDISCPYCQMYFDYKLRLANEKATVMEVQKKGEGARPVEWCAAKPAHRDRAAKRYMVKMFLADLYAAWRPLHGLNVRPPYKNEYLGKRHAAS